MPILFYTIGIYALCMFSNSIDFGIVFSIMNDFLNHKPKGFVDKIQIYRVKYDTLFYLLIVITQSFIFRMFKCTQKQSFLK